MPDPVRIGATLPLSGPLAGFGRAQLAGMERAAAEVHDRGGLRVGVERRRVELLVRDDGGDPAVAGQWLLVLIRQEQPVSALLGPCAVSPTAARVAEARRVPLVIGCAPAPLAEVRPAPSHTWQAGFSHAARAAAVLPRLAAAAPGQPVALFVSRGHAPEAYVEAARAVGLPVLGPYRPEPVGGAARPWRAAVADATAHGAVTVLAVTEPPQGRDLWQELHRAGLRPAAAFASEAALGGWSDAVGGDGDGVLTDRLPGGTWGESADEAVADAAAGVTRVLLAAVRRAGTGRPQDIAAALAALPPPPAPYALARREGDRLVPVSDRPPP